MVEHRLIAGWFSYETERPLRKPIFGASQNPKRDRFGPMGALIALLVWLFGSASSLEAAKQDKKVLHYLFECPLKEWTLVRTGFTTFHTFLFDWFNQYHLIQSIYCLPVDSTTPPNYVFISIHLRDLSTSGST